MALNIVYLAIVLVVLVLSWHVLAICSITKRNKRRYWFSVVGEVLL